MTDSTDFEFTDAECWARCEHGGECRQDANHEGPHNSNYCTWEGCIATRGPMIEQEKPIIRDPGEVSPGLFGRRRRLKTGDDPYSPFTNRGIGDMDPRERH